MHFPTLKDLEGIPLIPPGEKKWFFWLGHFSVDKTAYNAYHYGHDKDAFKRRAKRPSSPL